MPLQAYTNLAYSLVATAPAPADTGTSLVVTAGQGTRFPSVPFNATIWPIDTIPTPANAEIVTVTAVSTDTLTITRAQESTTARSVIVGDQIAATITALTLATLETDISVASAAATSANTHATTASAAATSADAHAAAASAAATSVDTRVNTVSNLVSALTSAHNALSNVVSDSLSIGNVASNVLSALSDRVVSISAQLVSLEVHASAASAAATSADAHAAAASAAAASVDGRVTSVNAAISAISARSVGNVSTHGFQSVVNALSNRISAVVAGAASATSQEISVLVQTASAAATSADAHAAAASAAATSVLAGISAVSARSVGDVSTHGLQSVVNALSNRISVVSGLTGGSGSVTSQEVSAQAVSAADVISNNLSLAGIFPAQFVRKTGAEQTVSSTTLVNISGLVISMAAAATYEVHGLVLWMISAPGTAKFGATWPALQSANLGPLGAGYWIGNHSAPVAGGTGGLHFGSYRGEATGSVAFSVSGTTSATLMNAWVNGVFTTSAAGTYQLQAAISGTVQILIQPNSHLRAIRLA